MALTDHSRAAGYLRTTGYLLSYKVHEAYILFCPLLYFWLYLENYLQYSAFLIVGTLYVFA